MLKRSLAPILFATAAAPALLAAQSFTEQYPPHTLPSTHLRVLPPTEQGRHYQLHVSLPASFEKEPTRRYPVLFVTDGYWDFATVVTSYDNLVWDKVVPEMVIVGLGYAGENLDYGTMRWWELGPVALGSEPNASGHADTFLDTIENVVIPLVESDYRADSGRRVLAGSSLGGLFTLYAMYARPGLFHAYIAASPWVSARERWLLGYEDARHKAGKAPRGRLFLSAAQHEWPSFVASIEAFRDRVLSRRNPALEMQFRMIESERHAGTKAEAYVRGMRYVMAPLAPETGPIPDDWQN